MQILDANYNTRYICNNRSAHDDGERQEKALLTRLRKRVACDAWTSCEQIAACRVLQVYKTENKNVERRLKTAEAQRRWQNERRAHTKARNKERMSNGSHSTSRWTKRRRTQRRPHSIERSPALIVGDSQMRSLMEQPILAARGHCQLRRP